MNHHITRRDGRWEVHWTSSLGKELLASSPYGIRDAWDKAMDAHGRKAAEAYKKMQEIEHEAP